MDEAPALAIGDVLDAVQAVLDGPVAAPERQQAAGIGRLGGRLVMA
jgi:hypothetical protein